MHTVSHQVAEKQLLSLITQVSNAHEPLCIESPDTGNVVLIAEQDYLGLVETLYLLSNPVNAEKLTQAAQRTSEQAIPWEQAKVDLNL